MKLQIDGRTLRIRVDESELLALLDGHPVLMQLPLPSACFELRVACAEVASTQLAVVGLRWTLALPSSQIRAYQQRLPCREGLAFEQPLDDGGTVLLLFEVDVRDSVRVRGPRRRERGADQ